MIIMSSHGHNGILAKAGWKDFKRICPYCLSQIPKYRRVCPKCGKGIRNIQGCTLPKATFGTYALKDKKAFKWPSPIVSR